MLYSKQPRRWDNDGIFNCGVVNFHILARKQVVFHILSYVIVFSLGPQLDQVGQEEKKETLDITL